MTPSRLRAATIAGILFLASGVSAQQWQLGGQVGVGTGLEGGDPGTGQTVFRRARTRLSLGLDGRVDERPALAYAALAFAEIEPHVSAGTQLRVMYRLGGRTVGFVGGVAALVPHTLVGGEFGLQLHIPTDSEGMTVFFEPSFAALPLGTDIAGDNVVLWGLFNVGLHVGL